MKCLKKLSILITLIIIYILIADYYISANAEKYIYDIETIPKNKVGLVLGTRKYTNHGTINLYYKFRLEAALLLYQSKKIDYILISGDNGTKGYDEPTDFKNDLIKKGIPKAHIFLDYAGFRTLDSVVRAKTIFGQDSITIISQKFHNERAIYLANHSNINAIAFNAKTIKGRYGLKTQLREYLARTKATIDVLLNVKPKFLGKKIEIK